MSGVQGRTDAADVADVMRVLNRYAWSLDTRAFADLRAVFTADAVLDYGSFTLHGAEGVVSAMEEVHAHLDSTQHLLGSHDVTLLGDVARSRCQVMATLRQSGRPPRLYRTGAWYADDLTRTRDGWRISRRLAHAVWREGDTDLVRIPTAAGR